MAAGLTAHLAAGLTTGLAADLTGPLTAHWTAARTTSTSAAAGLLLLAIRPVSSCAVRPRPAGLPRRLLLAALVILRTRVLLAGLLLALALRLIRLAFLPGQLLEPGLRACLLQHRLHLPLNALGLLKDGLQLLQVCLQLLGQFGLGGVEGGEHLGCGIAEPGGVAPVAAAGAAVLRPLVSTCPADVLSLSPPGLPTGLLLTLSLLLTLALLWTVPLLLLAGLLAALLLSVSASALHRATLLACALLTIPLRVACAVGLSTRLLLIPAGLAACLLAIALWLRAGLRTLIALLWGTASLVSLPVHPAHRPGSVAALHLTAS